VRSVDHLPYPEQLYLEVCAQGPKIPQDLRRSGMLSLTQVTELSFQRSVMGPGSWGTTSSSWNLTFVRP
jgi:hypothetical protein